MTYFDFKPVPIYKEKLNFSISEEQKTHLKNLEVSKSLLSKDMNLLDNKIFDDLKQKIYQHSNIYAKKICSFTSKINFVMTESWYRETTYNQDHPMHNHPNSVLSGVYYISVPEGNNHDYINFFCEDRFFKNFQFQWTPLEYNKYNSNELQIQVESDTIILFPSWLNHYVKNNVSPNESRQIISFNFFVKGIFDIDNEYPSKLIV